MPLLEINITYDGIYPNLCTGTLTIEINKHVWIFPNSPLISGGSYSFEIDEGTYTFTCTAEGYNMQEMADVEVIGPVLNGLNKSVHILPIGSTVTEIVNMVMIAALDSQCVERRNNGEDCT